MVKKSVVLITYSNVTGLATGNGVTISRSDSINISKQATAVNTIAPTAIGQKSLGVPSIEIGAITAVIIMLQSQKCKTNMSSRLAKLWDAMRRKITCKIHLTSQF